METKIRPVDKRRRAATLARAIKARAISLWHTSGDMVQIRNEDYDLVVQALEAYAEQEHPFDSTQLCHGLYEIEWVTGGKSLAAVGSLHDGTRWFAPCNWTSQTEYGIASTGWAKVKSAWIVKEY